MTVELSLVLFSCFMSLLVLVLNEYEYRRLSRSSTLRFAIVALAAAMCLASLLSVTSGSAFSGIALRGLVLLTVATPLIHFLASRFTKATR
jgi:hypothetical protein